MTNTHDQSTWRRLEYSILVVGMVLMAVMAAVTAVEAWAWSEALLWPVSVIALSATVMLTAELLGRTSIWSVAVVEQVRGLCLVLMAVSVLPGLAIYGIPDPWWLGLVDLAVIPIIAGAVGVGLIIRARRRMR
jgi:hypothetical protein